MEDRRFHTVDLSTVKQITVSDILLPKGILTQNLDYSSPVPTGPISIPHQSSGMGLNTFQIGLGAINCGAFEMACE